MLWQPFHTALHLKKYAVGKAKTPQLFSNIIIRHNAHRRTPKKRLSSPRLKVWPKGVSRHAEAALWGCCKARLSPAPACSSQTLKGAMEAQILASDREPHGIAARRAFGVRHAKLAASMSSGLGHQMLRSLPGKVQHLNSARLGSCLLAVRHPCANPKLGWLQSRHVAWGASCRSREDDTQS